MEPRRQEHGPLHGVGRGGPEPADLQVAVGRGAHLRVAFYPAPSPRRSPEESEEERRTLNLRIKRDRPPPLVRAEPPAGHVPLVQVHEPGDAPARRRAPALRALGLLVVLVDVPRERRAGREARVRELVARRRRPRKSARPRRARRRPLLYPSSRPRAAAVPRPIPKSRHAPAQDEALVPPLELVSRVGACVVARVAARACGG